MTFRIFIPVLFASSALVVAEQDDLLRFDNGDQLHGKYQGITEGPTLIWQRDDVGDDVKFKTSDVRQIVLRSGRPERGLASLSHVGTVNGDRIPGTVKSLDDKRVLLETDFAGMLEIPRDRIGLIAPSPLGGRILYHGPFDRSAWSMINQKNPDGLPDPDDKKADEFPRWKFSGSAWYWENDETGTALIQKAGMPDRAIFKFEAAWKGRLSLAIGFHANFSKPDQGKGGEDDIVNQAGRTSSLPGIFGDSYVLHLYSNYVTLYRTGFDKNGRARTDRLQTNNSNVRLGDSGTAVVEVRCNRDSGEIILFINSEFVTQWSEPVDELDGNSGYAGRGNGFGFIVQATDSPVRISEVVLAEWNGMPDAARSLQVDDEDIVLLNNGTDRFSGKVAAIDDGKLTFEGRYGDFVLPMEEVAEIRFARSKLAVDDEAASDSLKVRFYPLGLVSGKPVSGGSGKIRLLNSAAGEININLDSATMLEFQETESYLDDWDNDF